MDRIAFVENNMPGTGAEVFRTAKQLGLRVTLVTRDRSYYERHSKKRANLFDYVDDVLECDSNSAEEVASAMSDVGAEPFDAVATVGDYHIAVVAEVARELGLPGLGIRAAQITTNKLLTQNICTAAGIPVARYASCETAEEALRAAKNLGLPCVVKPLDESGSVGVALCETAADIEQQFRYISEERVNPRGQPRSSSVLVEEYLLGYEASVESVTSDGHTTIIGVTDKHLSTNAQFVEVGHTFPSCLPKEIADACALMAKRALDAVGYDFGASHVELKVTPQGPKLIEINPRPAGDRITDLIELSTGISVLEEVLGMHVGRKPTSFRGESSGAAIRYITAPPGRVARISGQDLAASVPGVQEASVRAAVGDMVGPLRSSSDRLGHVIASAEHPYVAARLAEAAAVQIHVVTVTT